MSEAKFEALQCFEGPMVHYGSLRDYKVAQFSGAIQISKLVGSACPQFQDRLRSAGDLRALQGRHPDSQINK